MPCDYSWIYCYDPETKRQSSQGKHAGSPRPKKARQSKSTHKLLMIPIYIYIYIYIYIHMIVKHLKHEESNSPSSNDDFGSRNWPRSRTIFILNIWGIKSVCLQPGLLVIWDFLPPNNHRLILYWPFSSNIWVTRVFFMQKYVKLHVWKAI